MRMLLIAAMCTGCLVGSGDGPSAPQEAERTDGVCWSVTVYPDCAVASCPLGVSDEPLRTVPCMDRGDNTLCFCRQPEGSSPLCGLHSQVWVYHC